MAICDRLRQTVLPLYWDIPLLPQQRNNAQPGIEPGPSRTLSKKEHAACSHVITHRSTFWACRCLTSQSGRDGVLPPEYGRIRQPGFVCTCTRTRWLRSSVVSVLISLISVLPGSCASAHEPGSAGRLAQVEERPLRIREVEGSNPAVSTFSAGFLRSGRGRPTALGAQESCAPGAVGRPRPGSCAPAHEPAGDLAQWQSTGLVNLGSRVRSSQWPSSRWHGRGEKCSPTRIRTAVAGFRVLSANHYTMGDTTTTTPTMISGQDHGPTWLRAAEKKTAVTGNRTRVGTATTWCSNH